jgi:putative transposase
MPQPHPYQHGLFLITTNTQDRKPIFLNHAYAREAIETLYCVQIRYPFVLYGFVIMPNHCHFLLRVPESGSLSKIMNVYKGITSLNIGNGSIWQPRFHVRWVKKPRAALKYVHQNPVIAGFVSAAEEYPWSSASGRWDIADI